MSSFTGENLLYLITTENSLFKQALPVSYEPPKTAGIVMNVLTNFDLADPKTLLSNAIPGMHPFDTAILYAGEGTNLSNMPRESLPPEEALEELAKLHPNDQEHEDNTTEQKQELEKNDKPNVLIYHTHSYESYFPELGEVNTENANKAVSSDPTKNIINVGNHFSQKLTDQGIPNLVDQTNMNAYMSKRGMKNYYTASRQIVESYQDDHQFDYILDFHRDSLRGKDTTITINNKEYARLLFVVGLEHPNYEAQEKLATYFFNKLEEEYPGLVRGVFRKDKTTGNGVYNQDMAANALLVEYGGVDNTMEQALNSAEVMAELFVEYYEENQ
ncbi:stage II sporulation protein P [Bacillus sp. JCM 19046]|nr:stage II sporulation protein P [Bacillus sp. JCM 19046]